MAKSSRRGFLKAASATAASIAVSSRLPALSQTSEPSAPVKVWSTFRDRRHAPGEPLAWKPFAHVNSDAIVLAPEETRQEMLGFGAALTDASCYLLSQMPEAERMALMHECFAPGEMAMNVCRTCIGSSDCSRSVYSYDDGDQDDPQLTRFTIDHDKAYILPILRNARRLNPDLFLFSSPWSPPGWMKFSRSMLGGTIRKSSLEPYSRYMLKFLDAYKTEGVSIDAITVQNEVDTTVDGRYPACQWSQEDEILFVRKYLGPLLRSSGSTTKIWVLDHNFDLWGRAIAELSDAAANQFIDGIAWHGYAGVASSMTPVHDAFPQKHAFFTEGGPQRDPIHPRPDPLTAWSQWAEWANGVVRNWARSITMWNLALDENGTPYIGHREPEDIAAGYVGRGVVTIESGTHKVIRSGRFWALAHYSKHVRRGARVFRTDGVAETAAQTSAGAVSHAGFRNPDGSYVVVLSNRGTEIRVQLVLGAQAVEVDLPADSVHTFEWS
jgi:glucosylceramidase